MKWNIAEIMNLRNLERVLAREEEVKKRAIVHKSVYSGPQIRYSSKDGKHSLITSIFLYLNNFYIFSLLVASLRLVSFWVIKKF